MNGLLTDTSRCRRTPPCVRSNAIPGPTVDRMLRDALGTLEGDLKLGVVARWEHAVIARRPKR